MVKVQTQKNDDEFIREYEELKLKQKLLIESLKKKGQTQESKLFMDVNSKLDFLVKIFKDSIKEDEEEKEKQNSFEEDVISKIDALMEKLTETEEKFNKKFEEIEDKLKPQTVAVNNETATEQISESSAPEGIKENKGNELLPTPQPKKDELAPIKEEVTQSKPPAPNTKEKSLPPPPDFKAGEKIDEKKTSEGDKDTKKKKWF